MLTSSEKLTAGQLLIPLCLVAFVVFVLLAFQTTQIVRERHALTQTVTQQASAVEQAQKVDAQVNALAAGTAKLADKGDKNAEAIVTRMKQMGITLGAPPPAAQVAPAGKAANPSASVPVAPAQ